MCRSFLLSPCILRSPSLAEQCSSAVHSRLNSMSLLLNGTVAQQLSAGTYGSPRTSKGPLVPLPTQQHSARVRTRPGAAAVVHADAFLQRHHPCIDPLVTCHRRHAYSSSLPGPRQHPRQQQAGAQPPSNLRPLLSTATATVAQRQQQLLPSLLSLRRYRQQCPTSAAAAA